MRWTERWGFVRSWIMYYAKPFNRQRLKRFYSLFIQPGDLTFDIGAHVGNRTQAFLNLGAKVIAVEPQPIFVDYLQNKFRNNLSFTLVAAALGKESGFLDLAISHLSPTISTARGADWQNKINLDNKIKARWNEIIQVPQTTLDKLIEQYGLPNFCKIDTEGFEWELVQGLNTAIPIISLEFLDFDKHRLILCIDKLSSLGNYRFNISFGESQKLHWHIWVMPEYLIHFLETDKYPRGFGDIYAKIF